MASVRRHQRDGKRSPHKSLLLLMVLGQLAAGGDSTVRWSRAQRHLADLIANFGPPSATSRAQSAAYPFTRLRSDGIWILDRDVPMDRVLPLADHDVAGRLDERLEDALRQTQPRCTPPRGPW